MGVKERKAREFKQREEDILATAYQLLTELAPGQMTMEMIAEKAEIGRGTIYKHFKSKDEIYGHLVLRRRENFMQRLRQIRDEGLDHEAVLIRSYMEYSLEDPEAYRVHKKCINHCVRDNLSVEITAALAEQQAAKNKLIEEILEDRLHNLPQDRAELIYYLTASWNMQRGAIDAMLEDRIEGVVLDRDKYFEIVESLLLNGFPTRRRSEENL